LLGGQVRKAKAKGGSLAAATKMMSNVFIHGQQVIKEVIQARLGSRAFFCMAACSESSGIRDHNELFRAWLTST